MSEFICKAGESEDGEVDYLNPAEHEAANPNYGITIRPEEMQAAALEALPGSLRAGPCLLTGKAESGSLRNFLFSGRLRLRRERLPSGGPVAL